MNRFVALVWSHRSEVASKDKDDVFAALAATHSAWAPRVDAPGLLVLEARHRSSVEEGLDVGAHVSFVGTVLAGQSRALSKQLQEAAFIDSRGASAFTQVWGRYVCFVRDVPNACVFVVRDPSGALPCYVARRGNAFIFFSHGEDIHSLGLGPTAIDWSYVALRLVNNRHITTKTGLEGVSELKPGAIACVGQSRLSIAQIWRPEAIARTPLEAKAAKSALRDAVETACGAWANCFPRFGLRLSGGLDSSIVLACMPDPARVRAINFATSNLEGDERSYARAAAEFVGASLFEVLRDPSRVSLEAAVQLKPALNPPLWLADGETDEIEAAFAAKHGLTAFFSGRGGDNVFFRTLRNDVLADHLMARGPGLGFWRRCWSHAVETGAPFWGSAFSAWCQAVGRDPEAPTIYPAHLTSKAIGLLPAVERAPERLPPGKRLHLALLEDRLNYFDWRPHADYIYPLVAQPVLEVCLRLPTFVLSPSGRDRGLAREAFGGRIAPQVLRRRSKGQTSAYLAQILLRQLPFLRKYLLDGAVTGHGLVSRDVLSTMLSEANVLRASENLPRIVGLLSVEAWLRNLPRGVALG
ncbi:MAG: asparagine synthetase B family protein [Terricaulis sp.]